MMSLGLEDLLKGSDALADFSPKEENDSLFSNNSSKHATKIHSHLNAILDLTNSDKETIANLKSENEKLKSTNTKLTNMFISFVEKCTCRDRSDLSTRLIDLFSTLQSKSDISTEIPSSNSLKRKFTSNEGVLPSLVGNENRRAFDMSIVDSDEEKKPAFSPSVLTPTNKSGPPKKEKDPLSLAQYHHVSKNIPMIQNLLRDHGSTLNDWIFNEEGIRFLATISFQKTRKNHTHISVLRKLLTVSLKESQKYDPAPFYQYMLGDIKKSDLSHEQMMELQSKLLKAYTTYKTSLRVNDLFDLDPDLKLSDNDFYNIMHRQLCMDFINKQKKAELNVKNARDEIERENKIPKLEINKNDLTVDDLVKVSLKSIETAIISYTQSNIGMTVFPTEILQFDGARQPIFQGFKTSLVSENDPHQAVFVYLFQRLADGFFNENWKVDAFEGIDIDTDSDIKAQFYRSIKNEQTGKDFIKSLLADYNNALVKSADVHSRLKSC